MTATLKPKKNQPVSASREPIDPTQLVTAVEKALFESLGGMNFPCPQVATDEQVRLAILETWRKAPTLGRKKSIQYCWKEYDPRWGTGFWINTPTPIGEPHRSTGAEHVGKDGDCLVLTVRQIYDIRQPSMNGKVAHPSTTSTTTPAGIVANDPDAVDHQPRQRLSQAEFLERAELQIKAISDSPFQARMEPTTEEIDELAKSIEIVGLLKPLRVRELAVGKYQLIGGHRRLRAVTRLGWKDVMCDIVKCDDATAAIEVGEDNHQQPLNAIEKATERKLQYKAYQAAGRSMSDLAKDLGVEQGTISNQIRLLEAPGGLQQRLIVGDISQGQLRSLIPWTERPKIVDQFMKELKNQMCDEGPISNRQWNRCLERAIESQSKSVMRSSGHWIPSGTPLFDCSKHDDLEIIEYKIDGQKHRRAFNVKRWNELQAEAKKRKAEREKSAADKPAKKPDTRRTNRLDWQFSQGMQAAWDDAIWSALGEFCNGKVTKAQKLLITRLLPFVQHDFMRGEIGEALKLTADQWIDRQFECMKSDFAQGDSPYGISTQELLDIAKEFGIDFESKWTPVRELLSACELIDLVDIGKELEIDLPNPTHKEDTVQRLLDSWPAGEIPELFNPHPKEAKKSRKK